MDGEQPRQHSDLRLLYAARAARAFGDGFAIIVLPVYLTAVGFTPAQVGFIATAALLGSALMTLTVGVIAARHTLRKLLIVGAVLMVLTGLAIPHLESVALVGLVAFVGTLNPSSSDVGMLVPLEHAAIARSATDQDRTRAFSHYSLIGALAMAAGALAAATPELLVALGVAPTMSLRVMFYGYAALGLLSAALYRCLPAAPPQEAIADVKPLGPSRGIVYKLAALFSLDAFAGGFVVQSLLALWLFERFDLSLAAASVFFFWSNVLTAFSYPIAVRLAKRFGLVNTMVFTHIPSSVFLIVAAFVPNLYVVLALLLARSALSQMDVPTRTSYVMAVVTPAERTAAASFTAVPRSLASSLSPALAGALLGTSLSALPFVLCGSLKIVYDLALLWSFRHIKPPEERA
jgi:MFS family permease